MGKQICTKKLLRKAAEEAIKKSIEGIILAIILGATMKLLWIVPAAATGSAIAKIVKITLMER